MVLAGRLRRVVVMDREVWAEQALLGAVLSDPVMQEHILDVVR